MNHLYSKQNSTLPLRGPISEIQEDALHESMANSSGHNLRMISPSQESNVQHQLRTAVFECSRSDSRGTVLGARLRLVLPCHHCVNNLTAVRRSQFDDRPHHVLRRASFDKASSKPFRLAYSVLYLVVRKANLVQQNDLTECLKASS